MKESFKFEYKMTNMFHDIQPAGLSVYGERGLAGRDGTSGSTLYFVNYVDITDTIKTNLLRNIQNSYTLDGSSQALREYQNNDLIICKVGQSIYNNVYKITRNQKTNVYDIEKVGQLIVKTSVKNIFDTISRVKLNIGEYKETTCHIPVNRSYETNSKSDFLYKNGYGDYSLSETSYSDALRTLFGFSLHPTITITDKTNAENYNFYIKIYIKNTKSILGRNFISIRDGYTNANTASSVILKEPVTVENNIDMISFEKVIEIPVTKYYSGPQGDDLIEPNYNEVFLSDMGCDKLHPSLNNYSSSFFDPYRNRGYMTAAIDSDHYPFHAFSFSYSQSFNKYIINGQTIIKQNRNKDILESVLNYQAGPYIHSSDNIQYSKDPFTSGGLSPSSTYCRVNFRSGESAYFSGMLPNTRFPSDNFETGNFYTKLLGSLSDNSFDQYVAAQRSLNPKINEVQEDSNDEYSAKRRKYVMNYVCTEMSKFIFNEDNVFELICINKKSGLTKSKIYTLNQLQ